MRVSGFLAASIVALAASSGAANAQNACRANDGRICGPASGVSVASVAGDVLVSRGAAFSAIAPGSALSSGDRLLVRRGSAQVSFGPGCTADLGANTVVTFTAQGGSLCARYNTSAVSPTESSPAPAGGSTGGVSPGLLAVGGVGLAAGIVGLAVSNSDKKTISAPATAK
ncbi:MAG TPA: hypothetical protein VIL72_13770 [Beijerinckiaceae bacterium]|jgi:hypothetical protein